jgi:formylglycine-generating enzyme required for sulfatase activity/tRNA A-37 threonylcarbamoyl transferase component Bud32
MGTREEDATLPVETDETEGSGPPVSAFAPASEVVGRYQVRRMLGEGAMSQVYLARDTVLGRSVALKVIHEHRVSKAEAEVLIREARVTSRLNHPNIVQLYDAGLDRGRAFMALELLHGETLHARMRTANPSVDESLRIALALARGLEHAHAAHVFHCDLKPGNVILASDGRPRIVDFGLATVVNDQSIRGGTPDWMAPEQWRLEPASDRTDIWAFAVIVFQLLARSHPFGPSRDRMSRRDQVVDPERAPIGLDAVPVADAIKELLARSWHRDPSARPGAGEWVQCLETVTSARNPELQLDAPFRGLFPFVERHAHVFFGREAEIDAFLERSRQHPILPIVGPSGAGKSSFMHAGVVARLRARGHWCVIAMRPGTDAFVTLARQLLVAVDPMGRRGMPATTEVAELARDLRTTPTLLSARLATIAATRAASVLLVCDQLEEVFTQSHDAADSARFISMLMNAVDAPDDPIRVMFTLRDDFIGQMPELKQVFVLRRLTPSELRRTVTGPLDRLGYQFEDDSVLGEMLAELPGSPLDLPLLQFACGRLWEARDRERKLLLTRAYREDGGVVRALAQHADAVLAELPDDLHPVACQLLTSLVTPRRTRKREPVDALVRSLPAGTSRVIDHLVAGRLLSRHRVSGEDAVTLEIAHESLIATWGQLARWLDASHEQRRVATELEAAAAAWLARGRRDEHAPAPDELAAARERIERLELSLSDDVAEFLRAGDRRAAVVRRRQRIRVGVIGALASLVTLGSLSLARSFRNQKLAAEKQARQLRLAGANSGRLDLTVHVLDVLPDGPSIPADQLPRLALSLYSPAGDDLQLPGDPIARDRAHVERDGDVFHIEAPGGTVFVRIDGRGRGTERCAASWVRILAMPGFAARGRAPSAELAIPSCDASARDSVPIPAGPFIYGGSGDPPTRFAGYVQPEEVVSLPAFSIDRTEVSNAAFRTFAAAAPLTGYAVPRYPAGHVAGGADDEPVASIDAFEAEAFCRYMGKRLPTDYEWTKAARGGRRIDGADNPNPRRLYPWGTHDEVACANLDGDADGYSWLAPVGSMTCGASPYGVLHMAGNVDEWISRAGQLNRETQPLRIVRGGAPDSPRSLEQGTTIFRNTREARYFSFATGTRCATGGDSEEDSRWNTH